MDEFAAPFWVLLWRCVAAMATLAACFALMRILWDEWHDREG